MCSYFGLGSSVGVGSPGSPTGSFSPTGSSSRHDPVTPPVLVHCSSARHQDDV